MTRRRQNKYKKRDGGSSGGRWRREKDSSPGITPTKAKCHALDADYISCLSLEMLCRILRYLPLKDVMKMESCNHKMKEAVSMHLQLLTEIDFCHGKLHGWMPSKFVDETFKSFLHRCRDVTFISGLHPKTVVKRRQRGVKSLSIPGIIAGLQICKKLEGVEISDIFLLESMLKYLPGVEILGKFRNREGTFPIPNSNQIVIPKNPLITTLHLTGVVIPELPRMVAVEDLQLKWVEFTDPHPFREFGIPNLRIFVMRNCAGPPNALKYVPLITGLAAARSLERVEFVRVPFLGGLIQHVVEDSWKVQGFRQLKKITLGTCKHVLEVDVGYLAITCSSKLEELSLQASLSKDSFFASLALANVVFPKFETLSLGYEDSFPGTGKWSVDELFAMGLADVTENPCSITDIGMKSAGQVFSTTKSLSVYNCPHLHLPTAWFMEGRPSWSSLKELHLWRCHAISLHDFCTALTLLTSLESLFLEQMFREPPKGCSRVGLSAGTGLGASSALVSNTGNEAANDEGAEDNNPEGAGNEDAPQEGPSNQQNDNAEAGQENDIQAKTGNSAAQPPPPDGSDSENEDQDNMEPGVVETDGIFYTAPEERISTGGSKNNGEGTNGQSDQRPVHQGASTTSVGIAGECSNNIQEPHDSMSLESVICPGPSSCSTGMDEVELCDGNSSHCPVDFSTDGSSRALEGKGEHCETVSSCHICRAKAKTTITERKVGNQSVYVVEKGKHTCAEYSTVSKKSPTTSCSETPGKNMSSKLPEAACGHDTRASSNVDQLDTGCEEPSPMQGSSRKGKSLRGKKKGLVKRSSPNTCKPKCVVQENNRDSNNSMMVSQSCQAVSEEIRESTKKCAAEEEKCHEKRDKKSCPSKPDKSPPCGVSKGEKDIDTQSTATSPSRPTEGSRVVIPNQSRTRSYCIGPMIGPIGEAISDSDDSASTGPPSAKHMTRKPSNKRKVATRDQSTSTSDPVIEEDHEQVLAIHSPSLLNLTLHQVGVTSLLIGFCPKLKMLSGTACRVLKHVSVKKAPGLVKVSFAQCKKLRHTEVVREVCSLPGHRKRLVFLRPMANYNMDEMVRCVFQPAEYNYHLCLIHDHSPDPSGTLYNQLRASVWPEFFDDISLGLMRLQYVPEAIREYEAKEKYPWGRRIYSMSGEARNGSSWEMLTDIPWIRPLSEECSTEPSSEHQLPPHTFWEGLYDPNSRGHYNSFQAADYLKVVTQTCAEYVESGATLFNNCAIVYVNTCDVDKPATADIYI